VNWAVSNLSLRAKLVAMFGGLTLVLTGLLLVELPRAMDRHSRGWLESRALGLGQLVAQSLEAALDFEDGASAGKALAGLSSTRGAAYAVLQKTDGSALAEWHRTGAPVVAPPGQGQAAAVVGELLRVRIPVSTRAGRAATLLLGFDLEELEARRQEARRSVLQTALLLLVVGLLAAVVAGTVLARPILRIRDVARRVGAGDAAAAADLPLGRKDEVGQLASVLSDMLAQLWRQQRQIQGINADLAEQVQARTQELERTNQALAQLARTQEQLVMADRRISVGRLAAGVAHEINNPLAFISGNLDYIASELPGLQRSLAAGGGPELEAGRERLAEVAGAVADSQQGARRVLHIVRGLKTFSRDDEDTRERLHLEGPIGAAIEMAHHEIKHRARLVRRLGPAPAVIGNEVRLSQVVLNLLINAAQAIPEGGSDQQEIRVSLSTAPDGRAVVAVTDTGAGMKPEVLNRIFDPFFTTKPVGVGSGLGLPISRNIVAKFGGEITVESEPGQGSTFRVLLPPADAEQPGEAAGLDPLAPTRRSGGLAALGAPALTPPPATARAAAALQARSRTPPPATAPPATRVLVIDDEPLVGQMVARALRHDAQVVPITSAREALALLQRGERFDRILCDLMMPEMSGPELHAELVRTTPQLLPTLAFMTGGAFTEGARRFAASWRGPLLEKPLDQDVLRRLLHDDPN